MVTSSITSYSVIFLSIILSTLYHLRRPFVDSWILKRDLAGADAIEKTVLPRLFDSYIDSTNESIRKGFKECTPLYLLNKVCTVIYLLEGLLETLPPEKKTSEAIENIFIYCVVWAFGGLFLSVHVFPISRISFLNQ